MAGASPAAIVGGCAASSAAGPGSTRPPTRSPTSRRSVKRRAIGRTHPVRRLLRDVGGDAGTRAPTGDSRRSCARLDDLSQGARSTLTTVRRDPGMFARLCSGGALRASPTIRWATSTGGRAPARCARGVAALRRSRKGLPGHGDGGRSVLPARRDGRQCAVARALSGQLLHPRSRVTDSAGPPRHRCARRDRSVDRRGRSRGGAVRDFPFAWQSPDPATRSARVHGVAGGDAGEHVRAV